MNDIYDKIDDYLDGKLNAEEAKQFGEEVRKDPELKEKLTMMKAMRTAYSRPDHMEYLAKVEEAHQHYMNSESEEPAGYKKFSVPGRYWLYALAAVIVMGIVLTAVLLSKRPSGEELYRKYYAAFDHQVSYRHNDEAAVKLNHAMELYRSGSYKEAAKVFKQAKQSFSEIAKFLLGLCYMEMEEFSLAAEHLKIVAGDGELQQEAQWYLALAQLAEGKREETRRTLRLILNTPDHYYRNQAQNLLEELG